MSREWKEALQITTPEDLDMQELEEEMLENKRHIEEDFNEEVDEEDRGD